MTDAFDTAKALVELDSATEAKKLSPSAAANIRARAQELSLDLSQAEIIWPAESPRLEAYVEAYWEKRRRKGVTRYDDSHDTEALVAAQIEHDRLHGPLVPREQVLAELTG